MEPLNANVAARLVELAARHPMRAAIVERSRGGSRRTTFGGLAWRVAGLAAALDGRGVTIGDRVLLFVPMSADLYIALLAVLHVGAVAVFVDAWAGRARLDAAVAAARPKAFIGTPKSHLLRLLSGPMRAIPVAIMSDPKWRPLERFERQDLAREAALLAPESPALVTFTTGSTGRPKAAARSHGFLWAQHEALASHLKLTESDVDLPTLPVFVLNNLAIGATSVIPDFDPRRPAEIDPQAIFEQIVAERVTTTSGSPAFYEKLARWCAERGEKLPVRALFTGGAPVLPPLARLLADRVRGVAHVVYGSTEAEPIAGIEARAMIAAMEEPGEYGLCVGCPVPEIALRILEVREGSIVPGKGGLAEWEAAPGEIGEIVVSGPHVLTGYLDDPEADRANKIRDGERVWHRTGDAGRLDANGRLWLMGRLKQRVRRAGETWWPTAAEVRALTVPGVRHAAYLGTPDERLGERAVLCVEPESAAAAIGIEERLRVALGDLPADEIRVLEAIPRDPRHASKTDFEKLTALLGETRGRG